MTEHDAIRDLLGAFALGVAEPDEEVLVEAHLAVCSACRAEVDQLRAASTLLALDVPQHEPRPELRRRIMGVVDQEAALRSRRVSRPADDRGRMAAWLPRRAGLWPALSAVLAVACAVLVVWVATGVRSGGGDVVVQAQARLEGVSGDARLVDDGRAAVVRLRGLPALEEGRGYELWAIDASGTPRSVGFMAVAPGGDGHVYAVSDDIAGATALAVTREPLGNTRAPSETPIVTLAL